MKKLILVAAPPACGKNYVSELICEALCNISYFDKDDLGILLRRSFELSGEKIDMDGKFYLQNLRFYEYETLFKCAFSALRFSDYVLVNAPLLREVRDAEYMRRLKDEAHEVSAELILVWVVALCGACYERMKSRNSDRDIMKLAQWEDYVRKIDYSTPEILATIGAVDKLFVFDNENSDTAAESLRRLLDILN